jgi:hypothetical protein
MDMDLLSLGICRFAARKSAAWLALAQTPEPGAGGNRVPIGM